MAQQSILDSIANEGKAPPTMASGSVLDSLGDEFKQTAQAAPPPPGPPPNPRTPSQVMHDQEAETVNGMLGGDWWQHPYKSANDTIGEFVKDPRTSGRNLLGGILSAPLVIPTNAIVGAGRAAKTSLQGVNSISAAMGGPSLNYGPPTDAEFAAGARGAGQAMAGASALEGLVNTIHAIPPPPPSTDMVMDGVLPPSQLAEDWQNPLQAARDRASGYLDTKAASNIEKALNPKSREGKAVTQNIAPELAKRGGVSALTGSGFDQNILDLAQRDGAAVGAAEDAIPVGTKMPAGTGARMQAALERAKAKYSIVDADGNPVVTNPQAVANLQNIQDLVKTLKDTPDAHALIQLRRAFDSDIQEAGGFKAASSTADRMSMLAKKQGSDIIRQELNNASPQLKAANANYHISRSAADIVESRQLADVGKSGGPTNMDLMLDLAGYGVGGPVGAGVVNVAKGLSKARGLNSTISNFQQLISKKINPPSPPPMLNSPLNMDTMPRTGPAGIHGPGVVMPLPSPDEPYYPGTTQRNPNYQPGAGHLNFPPEPEDTAARNAAGELIMDKSQVHPIQVGDSVIYKGKVFVDSSRPSPRLLPKGATGSNPSTLLPGTTVPMGPLPDNFSGVKGVSGIGDVKMSEPRGNVGTVIPKGAKVGPGGTPPGYDMLDAIRKFNERKPPKP